jgi:hypothetical protein
LQISYSSPSGLGQIFRADQCLAAKAGEHQAHQIGASRLDRQTRRQSGGSVEIIYSASFAVSLKQFIDRVTRRQIHHSNYATGFYPTKGKLC